MCSNCSIPDELTYADLNNNQIKALSDLISNTKLLISGKGEFKEEFVTCGGIKLSEIDANTMQSKIVPHLFFAGEV